MQDLQELGTLYPQIFELWKGLETQYTEKQNLVEHELEASKADADTILSHLYMSKTGLVLDSCILVGILLADVELTSEDTVPMDIIKREIVIFSKVIEQVFQIPCYISGSIPAPNVEFCREHDNKYVMVGIGYLDGDSIGKMNFVSILMHMFHTIRHLHQYAVEFQEAPPEGITELTPVQMMAIECLATSHNAAYYANNYHNFLFELDAEQNGMLATVEHLVQTLEFSREEAEKLVVDYINWRVSFGE